MSRIIVDYAHVRHTALLLYFKCHSTLGWQAVQYRARAVTGDRVAAQACNWIELRPNCMSAFPTCCQASKRHGVARGAEVRSACSLPLGWVRWRIQNGNNQRNNAWIQTTHEQQIQNKHKWNKRSISIRVSYHLHVYVSSSQICVYLEGVVVLFFVFM